MNSGSWRNRREAIVLSALLAAYVAAALYWLPRTRGQMNPDGISYLSLAQRYLEGNLSDAISGHWGPMFSWLLVPLLALRIEPFLACKIQMFATGLGALFGAWLWSSRYTKMLAPRAVACAALIPLLVTWAAAVVTPDLLVVCFLTYYAYFVSDSIWSRRSVTFAAIFGAFAYFSKSYGFVFFLAHFTLVCAVRWWFSERIARREMMRLYVRGLAIFFAFALPWLAILSVKYERPTFGTAAAYNFGLVGPATGPVGSQQHPMHTQGLIAPPNEHAVSAWDDPARMQFPPWPATGESIQRLQSLVGANLRGLSNSIQSVTRLSWLILAAGFVVPLLDRLRHAQSRLVFASVLSGALFAGGYVPLIIETRYLWIMFVLELMIVIGLLDLIPSHWRWRSIPAALIAAAFAFPFANSPYAKPPVPGPIETASKQAAKTLRKNQLDLRGRRLASDDEWAKALYLASLTRAHYFGTVRSQDPVAARQQIDLHRIDTFLVWRDQASAAEYLQGFRRVPLHHLHPWFALYEREP